jgi:hypothetical protein
VKSIRSMYEIRAALKTEIAGALNESLLTLDVEVHEKDVKEGTYFVKGVFKVTPLFSITPRRRGKFEAKLDDNLKIISLNITEEEKQ